MVVNGNKGVPSHIHNWVLLNKQKHRITSLWFIISMAVLVVVPRDCFVVGC